MDMHDYTKGVLRTAAYPETNTTPSIRSLVTIMLPTLLQTNILSRMRLAPGYKEWSGPQDVPLSIADSIATTLPPAQGIWYWDPLPDHQRAFSTDTLVTSLNHTLEAYPQFAGRIEEIPLGEQDITRERHGRFRVIYGTQNDPGIEVLLARCDASISNMLPVPEKRLDQWNASQFEFNHLFAGQEAPLALEKDASSTGTLPLMVIKITSFVDGGLAIATRLVHAMGDLPSLMRFMHDWAATNQAITFHEAPSPMKPLFNPGLVDAASAGCSNGQLPDLELIHQSRLAPIHRFDWWASKSGVPKCFARRTQIPNCLQHLRPNVHYGTPIPWHDWDIEAPVSHHVLYFSKDEILNAHAEAKTSNSASFLRISHLDSLLSHLWSLIIRARGITSPEDLVYLNFVLDYRPRLGLPAELISSPSAMVYAKSTGREIAEGALSEIAPHIRWSIKQMDRERISAFLHDCAYQVSSHRYWQYFAGRHHVSMTSWLNQGVQDLDFSGKGGARYFTPLIPDFMVQIAEAPKAPGMRERGQWYDSGVEVRLQLEQGVVEKVLQDPCLRRYRSKCSKHQTR